MHAQQKESYWRPLPQQIARIQELGPPTENGAVAVRKESRATSGANAKAR